MSLPRVHISCAAGEAPTVVVNGAPLEGVVSAQVTVAADGVPRVAVALCAASVEVELPAGVSVIRSGPSAGVFVQSLSPAWLEQDALGRSDDASMGESFVAALAVQAAEFDGRG